MLETLKKYWKIVVSVVGTILAYIFLKQYFQGDLLAELKTIMTKSKSDVLDEKKSELQAKVDELQKANDSEKEKLKETEDNLSHASHKEVEDYYKNKP